MAGFYGPSGEKRIDRTAKAIAGRRPLIVCSVGRTGGWDSRTAHELRDTRMDQRLRQGGHRDAVRGDRGDPMACHDGVQEPRLLRSRN